MDTNTIKYASPFMPLTDKTGRQSSKSVNMALNTASLKKIPAPHNINIKNLWLSDRFLNFLFEKTPKYLQLNGKYTIGQFSQQYPPTPSGVPYRHIPNYKLGRQYSLYAYTDLLNKSGLFPEKLSHLDSNAAHHFLHDVSPNTSLYLVDGRDAANWLWDRRGLLFTDELWARANKARLNVTSQLGKLPQSIYYAWSNNDNVNAYSLPFRSDIGVNNLFLNVFNPNYFDLPYNYSKYSGYNFKLKHGLIEEPWRRYMNFLEAQDHELSHSFNDVKPVTLDTFDAQWILDGPKSVLKQNMFFRKTNNPKLPYYDDATTSKRVKNFSKLFKGTYLERPSEYIGAMSRVKRYGAELGFDTMNPDPAKARDAMAKTLWYFTTHKKPENLTEELQRIHSWFNTAARNYNKEQQKLRKGILPYFYHNHIKDPTGWSPFYKEVLDFMTDSTIQGLVQTNPNNLNNTHLA